MSTRPLPDLDDPVAGPFWLAARQGRLEMQRCDLCAELRWPPAPICPECLAAGGTWSALSGAGTVWSEVTYRRAFHPGLRDEVPYRVALVELAEGPRVISNVSGPVPISASVRAVFEEVAPDVTLVRFVAAEEPGS